MLEQVLEKYKPDEFNLKEHQRMLIWKNYM